ncbi:S-layer homology domain-containing protein [Tumebacillus sp. ITR2]|uniref:S-layer homology domain-containing protein n=1 Tax=Tumebacillus amylolyticus TaxID=2801339 RepID=A0ABS1JE43_9BACL|nr:S-layer homology domain-containing protein [Tumebacillus amylolyticus]MBL0388555.1 S-layer homology domain-containing protein [Tumebacillus amylolyticus]
MKKKAFQKTTALLTVGLMLAGVPLVTNALVPTAAHAGNPVYSDLKGHYSEAAVQNLVSLGVLQASDVQSFNPDQPINRADFDRWLKNAVGTNSTALTHGNEIPRWEAALLVDKARVGVMGGNESASANMFVDHAQIQEQARTAVGRLYKRGVVVGEGYGFYRPDWKLTRGEAAVMLNALLDVKRSNPVDFNVVTEESKLPADVRTAVEESKNTAGVHNLPMQSSRYVLISAGATASNNTSIHVDALLKGQAAFFVKTTTEKVDPGQGKPYVILQMKPEPGKVYQLNQAKAGDLLKIGANDSVALRKDRVDLNNDGKAEETAAVINSNNQGGYLGLFDKNGNLKTRFNLEYVLVMDPVQLLVTDVTGDGKNDLLIESDLHGNGGMGAHGLRVFTQGTNGTFTQANVQTPDWAAKFNSVTYDAKALAWNIKSTSDNRSWNVKLVGPQWDGFDPSIFPKPYQVSVDSPYAVSVVNGKLTTRHYSWVSHQLASVFYLVPTYKYINGSFVVDSYKTEAVPNTTLTEK